MPFFTNYRRIDISDEVTLELADCVHPSFSGRWILVGTAQGADAMILPDGSWSDPSVRVPLPNTVGRHFLDFVDAER